MVADEQTHMLPEDDDGLERIARMLRLCRSRTLSPPPSAPSLQTVERHYARAVRDGAGAVGRQSATWSSPATSTIPTRWQTLHAPGLHSAPSDICRVIRGWHFGRYPRDAQSAEARERLTELTPALLEAFGQDRQCRRGADRASTAFLAGLPAGMQLFSLLQSNPALLELIATIMGAAPRLAAIITKRRPHVFDGLLDPALLSAACRTRAYLSARLAAFLEGARDLRGVLDRRASSPPSRSS